MCPYDEIWGDHRISVTKAILVLLCSPGRRPLDY